MLLSPADKTYSFISDVKYIFVIFFLEKITQILSIFYWNECLHFLTDFYLTNITFFLFVIVWDRTSIFSHGHPGTHSVYHCSLEQIGMLLLPSLPPVLRLKVCTIHLAQKFIFKVQKIRNRYVCVFICLMDYFNNLGMNTTHSPSL